MTILGRNVPTMLSLVVWLAVWELVGRSRVLFLIPPSTEVLKAALTLVTSAKFVDAVIISLKAFGMGMGMAIGVGIPLGVLMGRVKFVEQLLSMWVNIFVSAPLTAVVPVLMVIFGIGQATVVVTVFLFAIWVIVLDTQAGVKNINPSLLEMARSFGASSFEVYTKVIRWAALPEILCGLRLGLIRGVRGIVVGQLLVAILGLGELFEVYSRNFLMGHFWALVIFVFAFAFALAELVNYVERRIEYYAGTR